MLYFRSLLSTFERLVHIDVILCFSFVRPLSLTFFCLNNRLYCRMSVTLKHWFRLHTMCNILKSILCSSTYSYIFLSQAIFFLRLDVYKWARNFCLLLVSSEKATQPARRTRKIIRSRAFVFVYILLFYDKFSGFC